MALYAVCGKNGNRVIRAKNGARALELYGADEADVQRLLENGPEGILSIGEGIPPVETSEEPEPEETVEIDVTDLSTPRGKRRVKNLATGEERVEDK